MITPINSDRIGVIILLISVNKKKNTMTNIIILSIALMFGLISGAQNKNPDFKKAEDLKALGTGKIFEKDNSILKNIKILEIKEYWIVYEKNSSSHDIAMELIRRIEFPESKWGAVKIEFPNNKTEMHFITY